MRNQIMNNKDNRLRIMKRLFCIGLFLLSPFLFFISHSQEITVQAPQSVYVGDNFTVRFVVNEKASDFKGPNFKGFSLRYGPSTSTSTSMSFVNGHTSRSIETSFSYTLTADVEGTFTVGAATCKADGKQLSSKPFTIKVQKMTAQQQQQRQQQQQQRQRQYDPWGQMQQQQAEEPAQIDDKSLFARASVSKSNPYQGEQIIITYKIYTQVSISQFAIDKLPGNKGFWSEDLSVGTQVKQYDETVGDRRYKVVEIRRGALFAQESGKLTIEPLDLNVLAMVQRQRRRTGSIWDLFDDPFFNAAQAVERPLSTNRLTINARPLPEAPDGFTGGVGKLDVTGGLNMNQVKANEALSYRVTVSGNGNLMLIQAPQPQFPSSFEVYEPQVDDNIKKSDNGISGSRTFEWVIIPRSQGEYTIPELKFVYFDPASGQYRTQTIAAQDVEVLRGDGRATAPGKDDVRLLNRDINYIHPTPSHLRTLSETDHAGWGFWLAVAVIVIGAVASVVVIGRRREQLKDVAGMRQKRAIRLATKRLRRAASYLGTNETARFYEEIYRAIWGCLSDKYRIPLSQLSRESVSQRLEEKQVSADQQASIMQLLQDVDMARFAPGDASQHMQTVYNKALEMIAGLS